MSLLARTGFLALALVPLVTLAGALPEWRDVSDERLRAAASEPHNWLSHGGDYREQRFSTLDRIRDDNVAGLGLAWFFETDTNQGMQGTPLVVDGRMFISAAWSVVHALDARTGEPLWQFDPQVPRETSIRLCCGAINRGVAVWGDKVFVGSLDGRLIALDVHSGEPVWQVQTTDPAQNYSITGAPRVVNGKVVIGNGGSEYGVRGYVTAYDAETGEKAWRFYTIPGNPADGFENEAMARAAETWKGEWWKMGGGGTVWDAMAFDPELNLLYIGVGNGAPHNQNIRSPGGGDNLFLTSIVALNPDTGEYVWHYQQVPGESWDYTATQQMSLVDIEWQGEQRKVIVQAPKAGFFYLVDRVTGELLSAEPYVTVTWASHYDMSTGRPVENPGQRYIGEKAMVYPTPMGGHNWHPMSWSPQTGLMYIPALDFGMEFEEIPADAFKMLERHWNIGYRLEGPRTSQLFGLAIMRHLPRAFLLAWDPVAQQEAWRVDYPLMHNGGTLATAGNLVFQGTADSYFHAYRADNGERLWSFPAQNGIMAGPVTYAVDGEQYVAVTVGRGGALSMTAGYGPDPRPAVNGRVMAFRLGGAAQLPPLPAVEYPEPPPREAATSAELDRGHALYQQYCSRCHGTNAVSDGSIPDLRHLHPMWYENFDAVVLDGMMERAGMPRFDDVLDAEDSRVVRLYLIDRANEDHRLRNAPTWWVSLREWFYVRVVSVIRWMTSP